MIELPHPGKTRDEDRQEMVDVIDDSATTVMVVRGNDRAVQDFIERARRQEEANPGRRLIWIQDESLLESSEITAWFEDDANIVARVMNDRQSLFRTLPADSSNRQIALAYTDAERAGSA